MKGGGERKETCWESLSLQNICWNQRSTTNISKIYIYDPGSHVIYGRDWSGGKVLATLVWFVTEYIRDQQEPIREHKTGKCGKKPKGKNFNNLFFLLLFLDQWSLSIKPKLGLTTYDCVQAALGNSADWHFSDIATLRSLHTIKFFFFFLLFF